MNNNGFQRRSVYEKGNGARRSVTRRGPSLRADALKTLTRSWLQRMLSIRRLGKYNNIRRISAVKILGMIAAVGCISFFILWITLPNINDPQTLFAAQSTVIYDRNGVELYRLFSEQDRTYVPLDRIADSVEKCF